MRLVSFSMLLGAMLMALSCTQAAKQSGNPNLLKLFSMSDQIFHLALTYGARNQVGANCDLIAATNVQYVTENWSVRTLSQLVLSMRSLALMMVLMVLSHRLTYIQEAFMEAYHRHSHTLVAWVDNKLRGPIPSAYGSST